MSGVNGGIDYQIDLRTLPNQLSARITYIQSGPDSPTELIQAAKEIAQHSIEFLEILPVLVDMLGFNNPVAANIAVDTLSCAGQSAIPYLLRGVAAFNYAVNAYALRALGRIGDDSVLDVVLACAIRGPIPNVRRAACKALGMLHYDCGDVAYETLVRLADCEPDWGVRYAAIVALEGFVEIDKVDPALIRNGVDVVRAASEGRAAVVYKGAHDGDQVHVAEDQTVKARACLALEKMRKRTGVSAHV